MAAVWSVSAAPLQSAILSATTTSFPVLPSVLTKYGLSLVVKAGSTPFLTPIDRGVSTYDCGTVADTTAAVELETVVLKTIQDCEFLTITATVASVTGAAGNTITPFVRVFDTAGAVDTSVPVVKAPHVLSYATEIFTVSMVLGGRIPKGFAVYAGVTSSNTSAVVSLISSTVVAM